MADSGRHLSSGGEQPTSRKARRQQAERREQIQWENETPRRRAQQAPQQEAPRRRVQQPVQQAAPQRRVRQQEPQRRTRPPAEEPWREVAWQEETPRTRSARRAVVEPEGYRHKNRGPSKQSIPLIILVVILVAGVLFAGGKLASIFLNYRRDRSAYDDLANAALSALAERDAMEDPEETPDPEASTGSGAPISANWDYLRGINSDIIGWLYCEGTAINYPVMQTVDNDFYLHRGFRKEDNTAGSLFADPDSVVGIPLSNFIVYGHNMKDGSMFAAVENYLDPSFYEEHPIMWLLTPQGDYRIELIAGHIVESTLDNYPTYFEGDGRYQSYLYDITSHSSFRTHAEVTTQYQLITMSTCDYSSNYYDPRYLLQGLLIPVGNDSGTDDMQ